MTLMHNNSSITGSIPALVTPFEGDTWCPETLTKLVKWHVGEGSAGLVVCGTTGESPALSNNERIEIIKTAVKAAEGKISIIAGTGSNYTKAALQLTQEAEDAGADATLHATGYYNRPNFEQLARHYRELADEAQRPVILYDIPQRTGVDIPVSTIANLLQHPQIAGIKDSTGNLGRLTSLRSLYQQDSHLFSGDDFSALGYFAMGGNGWISVVANVAPALCAKMSQYALQGDFIKAREINDRLHPLATALTIDPNPAGPKYALSLMGKCTAEVRSPLGKVSPEAASKIEQALSGLSL